ncbi:hypothetical protein ASG90_07025 [Nocardioides sp. Soil797]|nr:hypothetical protein ASG90_07025 [Nocardioides sp. Soil797]
MVQHRAHLTGVGLGAAALVIAGALPSQAVNAQSGDRGHHRHHEKISTVAKLSGPRGVESIAPGRTLVTEDNGDLSLVIERRHRKAKVIRLAGLPKSAGFANAVSHARGRTWVLTGAGEAKGSATLFKLKGKRLKPVANLAKYAVKHPDPFDLEDFPEDSNPYNLQALRDGTVLVADAAANSLLRVWPNGKVRTVARVKPRTVKMPEGLPPTDPDGNPLPPAGTPIPAEAVITSVTVGADGYWYISELRGFPGTAGTSQVWRIKPGSRNVVCNPKKARRGHCKRYVDGLTSVVDLSADRKGNLYATTLSKKTWLALEIEVPGAEVGALHKIRDDRHRTVREIAKGKVIIPGGTDVAANGDLYLTGPVFGPGTLRRIR